LGNYIKNTKGLYQRKAGQVLTVASTTIAPDEEEKVLEALRPFGTTLVIKGNESRAYAVKEEVTADQLSI